MVTPTLLLILDGYGLAPEGPGNAVRMALTPFLDTLFSLPGVTSLQASGRAVGLPAGYMGNSEVGHLNIGAGRVVYQDMTRIDVAMENGSLAQNSVLLSLLDAIRQSGGRLHLAGLLSDGGVHSHIQHCIALARIAAEHGIPVCFDLFTDGRDTSPTSGTGYVQQLQDAIRSIEQDIPGASLHIASLCGRYYAMDRDKNWDRVQKAWNLMVHGEGTRTDDPVAALSAAYASSVTDEFLAPVLVGSPETSCLRDGDGMFFFNFRADRGREIVSVFHNTDFQGFDRGHMPRLAGLATMTSYDSSLQVPVAFTKDNLEQTLGEVVSENGLRQLRIAETEKYAHVTYFFSGGRETPFPLEERILVDSPKDVPTYDLKPEMSAATVTARFVEAWKQGYALGVCNLANPDMVGHTGIPAAVIKALETVDVCAKAMVETVLNAGGRVLVTADHGNAEELLDAQGQPQTAHSCNPVPLVAVEGQPMRSIPLHEGGRLCDIAPTILALWGIAQPEVMDGRSLLGSPRQ